MHSYDVDVHAIRAGRKRAGLTQADLAERIGFATGGIRHIEASGRCRLRTVHALERALDISLRPDLEPTPTPNDQGRVVEFVRQERRRRFLTQAEVADRSGIPCQQIRDVEQRTYPITGVMLTALRPVLDLPHKLDEFTPTEHSPPRLRSARGVIAPEVTEANRPVRVTELGERPVADTSWALSAPCASSEPGLFDPVGDDEPLSSAWSRLDTAWRDHCLGCPFLVQCRTVAVTERFEGIWGAALFRSRADGRHRMLFEMATVDIPVTRLSAEPFLRQCAHCAESFTVQPTGRDRRRLYCATACRSQAINARRRQRSRTQRATRAAGARGTYGPNVAGPATTRPPRDTPLTEDEEADLAAFRQSFSLPNR